MRPLNRKLLRDLWRIKGQATAIGAVIAAGVLLLVMMSGLVNSLDETRRAYYERYRLADVFAPVKRAPNHLLSELAAIAGVSALEGRIVGRALIDLPGISLPLQAQAVSLPDFQEPRLNDVYLSAGRPLGNNPDEILLLKGFADAHGLRPGDSLRLTLNGARHSLRIAGLAQSPEFLYATAPGELMSDDARFGVLWMRRSALAAAYDLDGAFNEVLLALGRSARKPAVLEAIDRVLEPYGGLGAYGLENQNSNRFISEEIHGLRATSGAVPPLFLAVAAFLLYIVISRIVQAEREQIGLIKSFGYSDLEVARHYLELVLAIAAGGALAGALLGILAGRALVDVYLLYFKFPFLVFELDPRSLLGGFSISVITASMGGLLALRRVVTLSPALAMRPPAPPDYRASGHFATRMQSVLDQPSRMVLRRLTRQPARMVGAMLGIAAGMALSVAMLGMMSGFDRTIDLTFNVIDQSDMSVSFTQPLGVSAIFALRRLPGVLDAQPIRFSPAELRYGRQTYLGAISALPANPHLYRAIDSARQPIGLPPGGIVLSQSLARILGAHPGDTLTVNVREGRRPTLNIPIVAIADSLLGAPAFMDLESLNRVLGEPRRVSGAYVRVDSARRDTIYQALKNMPNVAGVSLKDDARAALQQQMDSGAGAMRFVMLGIAAIISFGIVYNAARIAHAERARDLASLRVMGFSRGEAAFVLLGELAIVTIAALPLGGLLGYYLSFAVAAGFSTDLYQIPAVLSPRSLGVAALTVVGAALASGWLVKRDLDRADLVSALKIRE